MDIITPNFGQRMHRGNENSVEYAFGTNVAKLPNMNLRHSALVSMAASSLFAVFASNAFADEAPPPLPAPSATAEEQTEEAPRPEAQRPIRRVAAPAPAAQYQPYVFELEGDQPVPPGYHVESRARTGLIVAGATTFGSLYLINVLTGAMINDANRDNSGTRLFIPIVGPLTYMGGDGCGSTCSVFLAVDSLAQAAGVAMFIAGFAATRDFAVKDRPGQTAKNAVRIMPTLSPQQVGVVGTF